MAFFDELGKKITQTSQGVVQKTKDTAETLKLNGLISDEEKRVNSLFNELGKAYFELHADSNESEFEKLISDIKEAQAKIENYAEQVKKLKGVVSCPNCGGEVAYGAPFCSSCGSKMNVQNDQSSAVNSNVQRCVNCGVPITPGTAFCTNCGTKVEAESVENNAGEANASVEKNCPVCGKQIEAEAKFCIGCGTRIEE